MGTYRDDYEPFTFTGFFGAILIWVLGAGALVLMRYVGLGSEFVLGMLAGAGLLFCYQERQRAKESSAEWDKVQRELAAGRKAAGQSDP